MLALRLMLALENTSTMTVGLTQKWRKGVGGSGEVGERDRAGE